MRHLVLLLAVVVGLSRALPAWAGTGVLILIEERGVVTSYNPPQFSTSPGGQVTYIPPTPNVQRQRFGAALIATPGEVALTAMKSYLPVGDNTWYTGAEGKPVQAKEGDILDYRGKSYKIVGEQNTKLIFKCLDNGKFYSVKLIRPPAKTDDDK